MTHLSFGMCRDLTAVRINGNTAFSLPNRHYCSRPLGRRGLRVKAEQKVEIGDFGSRDPTPGELASNFSDKVVGNWDTSHIIRGPEGLKQLVGLHTKKCIPCEGGKAEALDKVAANKLRNQVPGWQLRETPEGQLSIRQEWKVKNFEAGLKLFERIGEVAEAEGHHPDLHLEGYNTVYAELSTHSVGGLTENDFIMAAKINMVDVADLMPKKKPRFWA